MNASALSKLLKKVYLQGIINECALNVDSDGTGTVIALDLTQSVVVSVSQDLGDVGEDQEVLGLTNLGTIIKFLDNCADTPVIIKTTDSQITFKAKGKGFIRVALMNPKEIPTSPTDSEGVVFDKFKKQCPSYFTFNSESIEQFAYYMGLIGAEGLILSVNKKGRVTFESGEAHAETQFNLPIGKVTGEVDIQTKIFAKYLLHIVQSLGKEESPVIHLGSDAMVLIQQGDNNFWAINNLGT